jgi:ABC-type bacteriocin/lantibiotic exporter with double-glycine peptidase domain
MVIFIGITRNFLSGYISNYINVNVNKSIKNEYMKNITKIEIGTIEGESSGDLITKHNEDIGAALGFIQNAYTNLLVNPLMAISGLIYLCFYSWQLSLVVFIPVPVLSIILNYMSTRAGRIHNIRMQDIGEYTEYLSDTYNGVVTIKANNIQKKMIDKISNSLQKLYKTNCRYSANGSVTLGLILAVGYIPSLTALIYGGTLVLSGVISVSVLFAFNQLIDVVSTPAINISVYLTN